MKISHGRNHIGSVVWIFEGDFITNSNVAYLVGRNVRKDVSLKPLEGEDGAAGGNGREDFVRNADHEADSSS